MTIFGSFDLQREMISFAAGCFLLYFPFVWCRVRNEDPMDYGLILRRSKKDVIETLLISLAILLLITPAAFYLAQISLPIHRGGADVMRLAASGLAAAIIEEFFFRGWLQSLLRKRFSAFFAIVAVNMVFAPIHLIATRDPRILLTFFPGLVMGGLRERYGNVLPSIIFHFLGNLWAVWFFPFIMS